MAARTFRRTAGSRLAPLLVGVAAVLALAADASWPPSLWSVGAAAVLALAVAGLLLAVGDELVADDRGLCLRNRLLGRERALAWDEIVAMRTVTGRSGGTRLILVFPRRGRRLVLDALADMDGLAALVRQRTAGSRPGSL